jgi:hypothetical protein
MKRYLYLIRLLLLETECEHLPRSTLSRRVGRLNNCSFW